MKKNGTTDCQHHNQQSNYSIRAKCEKTSQVWGSCKLTPCTINFVLLTPEVSEFSKLTSQSEFY